MVVEFPIYSDKQVFKQSTQLNLNVSNQLVFLFFHQSNIISRSFELKDQLISGDHGKFCTSCRPRRLHILALYLINSSFQRKILVKIDKIFILVKVEKYSVNNPM
ncbi:unnamed protein product [Paramecium octaurelia]|uniref:Uncharacterized protein n=1 Tax=Paramecium octaurelia TaxID=43137 RepID=A0A8S1XE32_PAROT|nr:unnamed protein product [Paramecium octaurelia]